MARLSFRKGKRETGLRAVANPYATTYIRLDGAVIGSIHPPSRFGGDAWQPSFTVKEGNDDWKNVTLTKKFESEPEARAWIIQNFDAIAAKFPFYRMTDYEPWNDS